MIELLQVVQGRAEVPKFLGATRPERAEAPSPGRVGGKLASALYLSLRPVTVGSGRVEFTCES